jgi:hypothetical protein
MKLRNVFSFDDAMTTETVRNLPSEVAARVPLLMLHALLALRILGGLGDTFSLRSEGGLLNAIALLLFMVTMLVSVLRGRLEAPRAE